MNNQLDGWMDEWTDEQMNGRSVWTVGEAYNMLATDRHTPAG